MKATIIATASLLGAFAGSLPAVDPQFLGLVMPDVKVLGDVNVSQAKASPFGQYVISQIQNQDLAELAALTGFDPRKDLTELMCASNATPAAHTLGGGLAIASGNFDVNKITALAANAKATTETYNGVTIIESVQGTNGNGIAFLNSSLLVAGDIASVKGAIDRQSSPTKLPDALKNLVGQLSNTEDAWVLSTVSPATFLAGAGSPAPGLTKQPIVQQILSGWTGVKFGVNIVVTAQATADNETDATALANTAQFFANVAQMQAQQNPNLAALAKSISITASGTNVNFSASLPQDQFQALTQTKPRRASKQ
jgi:hypothetical protein